MNLEQEILEQQVREIFKVGNKVKYTGPTTFADKDWSPILSRKPNPKVFTRTIIENNEVFTVTSEIINPPKLLVSYYVARLRNSKNEEFYMKIDFFVKNDEVIIKKKVEKTLKHLDSFVTTAQDYHDFRLIEHAFKDAGFKVNYDELGVISGKYHAVFFSEKDEAYLKFINDYKEQE